jgi:hypothetical protein
MVRRLILSPLARGLGERHEPVDLSRASTKFTLSATWAVFKIGRYIVRDSGR